MLTESKVSIMSVLNCRYPGIILSTAKSDTVHTAILSSFQYRLLLNDLANSHWNWKSLINFRVYFILQFSVTCSNKISGHDVLKPALSVSTTPWYWNPIIVHPQCQPTKPTGGPMVTLQYLCQPAVGHGQSNCPSKSNCPSPFNWPIVTWLHVTYYRQSNWPIVTWLHVTYYRQSN